MMDDIPITLLQQALSLESCNREEKRRGETQQVSHTCIFSEENETKRHKERKDTGNKK
jgi:hypothetical protein